VAASDRGSPSAVVGSIILGFAVAFVVAFVEFHGAHVISRFTLRWELARAASLFAIWMPPLLFAVCAASMSLHREQGLRFTELIRPVLVPALVLALIFATLELTVLPGIRRIQSSCESLSSLFHNALGEAEEALQSEDIPRAQERIALCGTIDSREAGYKELNERIQRAILKVEQPSEAGTSDRSASTEASDSGATAYELYQKALGFFKKGDYYSAHWYAGKSLILDPGRRDVLMLQAEAWDKIQASVEDPADKARAVFYARKAQGYALLQSSDFLGAYRVFTDLAKEAPEDPDVIRYKKESRDRLSETAFFADDFRRAFLGGEVDDFAVRVSRAGIDHIVYASRVSKVGLFLYFEGFEYMETSSKGPILHVVAPYARLRGVSGPGKASDGTAIPPSSTVALRRVERNAPREVSQPRYIVGSPAPTGAAVLDVPMDFDSLSTLQDLQGDASKISFFQLITGSRIAETYGWNPGLYRREIALRISIPVVLIILVLLGTAVGARFRRDEEPGRIRMVLTLPVLTLLAVVPITAADHAGRYLLSRLFALLPASVAIAAWACFLAVLLAVSLLAVGRLGVHASE
jgi:hypothetical protein